MSPLVQYDPAIPSPPVNLLEGTQFRATTHRKPWFKAQWAVSPSGVANLFMVIICGATIPVIIMDKTADPWMFWHNVTVFVILATVLIFKSYQTVFMAPQIWRERAQSASKQLDEGGVVLVLASNIGASAIPFAEQVMHRGVEKDTVFVCIDRFMARYSWPYSPTTLFRNLSAVGLPPQSIIAHKASDRWGYKDASDIQYDRLPFQSNSISLVIADQAQYEYRWKWITRPDGKIYDEIIRVLQPGGKAIMADIRDVRHLVSECEQKGWKVEENWSGRRWFEYTKPVLADTKFEKEKDIINAV